MVLFYCSVDTIFGVDIPYVYMYNIPRPVGYLSAKCTCLSNCPGLEFCSLTNHLLFYSGVPFLPLEAQSRIRDAPTKHLDPN
jgi:hypothetical protein